VLARALAAYRGDPGLLVLALPRGGVPVAAEVAAGLGAPLEVFVVRKLGVPGRPELAMGAIASGGVQVVNAAVRDRLGVGDDAFARVLAAERAELARREERYRGDRALPELAGRLVVLVDDGMATGASMQAAVDAVASRRPGGLVVAVPVAPRAELQRLAALGVRVVCPLAPASFGGVSGFYADFRQVDDAEVDRLLAGVPVDKPAPGP
jgi:predicted phosphoribosyltransferase